jgi:hypothetical protein
VKSFGMAQAPSHQPVSAEALIHTQVSPCGIFGGQSDTGIGFSPISSVSLINIIPPWLSMLIYHLGNEQ